MSDIDNLLAEILRNNRATNQAINDYLGGNTPSGNNTPPSGGNQSPGQQLSPQNMAALAAGNNNASASFTQLSTAMAGATAAFEKFSGMGGTVIKVMEMMGEYGRERYGKIQDMYGSFSDIFPVDEVNNTTQTTVEQLDFLEKAYHGFLEGDAQEAFTRNIRGLNTNTLQLFFDKDELMNNQLRIRRDLAMKQTVMLNDMAEDDFVRVATAAKGLSLQSSEISHILEREIQRTGEASDDVFGEIANFAQAVSEETGISFTEITQGISDIIADVENFGDVSVEEAARIAGAMQEIGLSARSMGAMVGKFMNFDTAAESLGNLNTLLGVNFDAMEMMMLANTDREEFLYQMREAFLDSGAAIEDMTLAEKKLASQQMGMSIGEFETFMDPDRDISDTTAATAEAATKSAIEGFETMQQHMQTMETDSARQAQILKDRYFSVVGREAYHAAQQMDTLRTSFITNAADILPGYKEALNMNKEAMSALTLTGDAYQKEMQAQLVQMQANLVEAGINNPEAQERIQEVIEKTSVNLLDIGALVYDLNQQGVDNAVVLQNISQGFTEVLGGSLKAAEIISDEYEAVMVDEELREKQRPQGFQDMETTEQQGLDSNVQVPEPEPKPEVKVPAPEPEVKVESTEKKGPAEQANNSAQKSEQLEKDNEEERTRGKVFQKLLERLDNLSDRIGDLTVSRETLRAQISVDGKTIADALIPVLRTSRDGPVFPDGQER